MHIKKKSIVFLTPYPLDQAPSQRFRFEQYFSVLHTHNISFTIYPFLTQEGWSILYTKGKLFQKALHLARGFASRMLHIFYVRSFDYVFIHREASPIGPPMFEWIIAKLFRKKIIYDFDDAIWMTDNPIKISFENWIRWREKVAAICSWSYKISCGNNYLCAYAKKFNNNVVLNPTTIDSEFFHNPIHHHKSISSSHVSIGWTGSHSTLKYLKKIESVLKRIESKFTTVKIIVIANQRPQLDLNTLEFIPWQKETEAIDLLKIDIGIMPLPDDEWTKGKCGFKALQYMAMEIPAVISPVGVNSSIIDHGKNGFLARTDEEWYDYLSQLVVESTLRKKIGLAGRNKIIQHYSVDSNTSTFLSLFT